MSVSNEEMASAILELKHHIELLQKLDRSNENVIASLNELLDIKDKRIAKLEELIKELTK